jgi:hypothetical protein
MQVVDRPDLKIARMNVSLRRGKTSVQDMHHLIGTPRGFRHVVEKHRMTLFEPADYRRAFEAAGLRTSFDRAGLMGRGLWVGVERQRRS